MSIVEKYNATENLIAPIANRFLQDPNNKQ